MAQRSRKYGHKLPRNTRASSIEDYRVSDSEITLVQNERASEPPPVVLRDAISDTEIGDTIGAPASPGGFFDFVQQYTQSGSGTAKPFLLTRPPSAPSAAPPPPPPPLPRDTEIDTRRTTDRRQRITDRRQRTTDLPPPFAAHAADAAHAPMRPPAPMAPPPPPAPMAPPPGPVRAVSSVMPSTMPPPVAFEPAREAEWPARRERGWLQALTIAPVSALVAALVSSLVWSYHTRDSEPPSLTAEVTKPASASTAPAPCSTKPATADTSAGSHGSSSASSGSGSSSTVTAGIPAVAPGETPRVSVDSLPTLSGSYRSALAATPAAVNREAPSRPTESVTRASAASSRSVRARASSQASARESDDEPTASAPPPAPPPPSLPKSPDRAAMKRAVARAASAAFLFYHQ